MCIRDRCTCDAGFASSDCSYNCSRARDEACSGHGESANCDAAGDGTLCACDAGFATSDCSVVCDGGTTTCSSHGTCADGVGSDGACTCEAGYFGADCSGECPGGAGALACGIGADSDNPVNGECDDGGTGAEFSQCAFATDCDDCGIRTLCVKAEDAIAPPPPLYEQIAASFADDAEDDAADDDLSLIHI